MQMTEDVDARLTMFTDGVPPLIKRIALNMDQVEQYNPPPNPAKTTDSRAWGYIDKFGLDSWELDALKPKVIEDLIRDELKQLIDDDEWNAIDQRIENHRETLGTIADNYEDVKVFLEEEGYIDG